MPMISLFPLAKILASTFSDISKYTGLSKATISRYFNNPSYLTKKNADIIANALKELNYQE